MNTKTYNKRRISSSKSNILADLNDMESEFEVVNYMKKVFDKHGKPELYEKFCEEVDNSDDVPGVVAEKYVNKIFNSRRISSSQKGFENVAEGTKYDDYHIDTKGMGILDVENIIDAIESRGNQAVLTVQTSDGSTNHSQFGSKDWKEYKDSVNNAGNAITDVWVTEVEGGSYVRNSRQIKSSVNDELYKYLSKKTDCTKTDDYIEFPDDGRISDKYLDKFVDKYNVSLDYKRTGDTMIVYLPQSRQIKSARRPVKSSVIWSNDDYIVETFEEYGNGEFYVSDKDTNGRRLCKTFWSEKDAVEWAKNNPLKKVNTSRQIKSARYIATDPETGEVLGSADTYEEAVNEWGEDVTITDSEAAEGQENMEDGLFSSKRSIKSSKETFEMDSYITGRDHMTDFLGFKCAVTKNGDKFEWSHIDPYYDEEDFTNPDIQSSVYGVYDNLEQFLDDVRDFLNSEQGQDVMREEYEKAKENGEVWTEEELNHLKGEPPYFMREGLYNSRKITSAVDGGWEVNTSDVPEALDLFVEYFGKEDALEEIAKAMGDNVLQENIEWIAQQWGFGEEIEDLDVWEQYETAKEYMGVSELFNNLTQAAGYDELAADLAFIFRMNDFREWDKYDNEEDEEDDDWEDDEEIESSLQNSFPVKTVKNIMSGAWTEKQAAQNIAEKQNINVGYAKQILSSWIEQYKPKLIKSGILDIAEDINAEFDIDGDLESWAEQYTNREGKSNTVGGEMVRAAMQIIYRYNNDGDMIGRGYGNETVNAAARYITEKAEMGVNEQIQKWLDHEERADDYEYDNFIETFTTEIEQILRENPELFQKPNKDDYWNWKEDEDMNYGLDECYLDDGSGNQYWFRLDNDRWTCTGIELDPYSITYQEGDTINEGDEYSDEILSPGEEFGSFEADGFIYEYAGDDWDDDREEYTSWQITKVVPQDPYCDEGDTLDFYDLEPDELSGFRLFDHNGNEIDERTFLASSLKTK